MSIADYGFAIWETFYVTVLSTAFSLVIGLPLGVLLVAGDKDGVLPLPDWLMHVLNIIINILRSVPFLILMICVFPLTRALMGTTVGTKATIVPLVVAAFPFVARLVETSLRELDEGVVEAAQSMGATPFQIITKVMIPECLPGLISSMTTALTTILGYSAMSGVIGGGGLGKIALSYGYYRYQTNIMVVCVILLVLLAPVLYLFLKNIWIGAAFLLVLLVALFKGVALPELNLDALIYYSVAAYAALHGRKWAEAVWSWKRAALGVCLLAVGIVLSRSYYTHYFVPGIVLYQLLAVIGIWMMVNERWLGEVRPFMTCTFFIYATHFVVVRFLNKAAALLFPGSQLVSMFMYVCMPLLAVTLCYQAARVLRRYRPDIWKTLNGGR